MLNKLLEQMEEIIILCSILLFSFSIITAEGQMMKTTKDFEMVNIADEHMIIPIGEKAETVKGMFVLSDAAAFLIENMREDKTKEELISLLVEHYDVDRDVAGEDIAQMLRELQSFGLICE